MHYVSRRVIALRAKRDRLRLELGNICARCGVQDLLQFDCIIPQGREHHEAGWPERLRFYEQQHAMKNLQLLCRHCHVIKTMRDIARAWTPTEEPSIADTLKPIQERQPPTV